MGFDFLNIITVLLLLLLIILILYILCFYIDSGLPFISTPSFNYTTNTTILLLVCINVNVSNYVFFFASFFSFFYPNMWINKVEILV